MVPSQELKAPAVVAVEAGQLELAASAEVSSQDLAGAAAALFLELDLAHSQNEVEASALLAVKELSSQMA